MVMTATTKSGATDEPTATATPASWQADPLAAEEFIILLETWRDADEAGILDQVETWEFLRQALDEDRPSFRTFFP
jgi:hypothetical protein